MKSVLEETRNKQRVRRSLSRQENHDQLGNDKREFDEGDHTDPHEDSEEAAEVGNELVELKCSAAPRATYIHRRGFGKGLNGQTRKVKRDEDVVVGVVGNAA